MLYLSSIRDSGQETVFLRDGTTGKTLIDRCDCLELFAVNGRAYYCAVKDNDSLVANADGSVLLRMPCAYLD